MLSDRRQRVLAALIEEYVSKAIPVGSRTLTERYQLGVSPATVRNELSYLEDGGYISQPHTSAGRIPTDFGYRTFVDGILASGLAESDPRYEQVADDLRANARELDTLLEQTSAALARMTSNLSIVLAPSVMSLHVRQITLVSLSLRRGLVILVTEDGQVINRQMEFGFDVDAESLAFVQGILNDALVGTSLQDIENGLCVSLNAAFGNPVLRTVLTEVVECLRQTVGDSGLAHSHRIGMSALLAQPEFAQSQAVVPLIQVLEDDTVLLQLLDEAANGENGAPSVRIGAENGSAGLSGVSVVASRYGHGDQAGVVAVIGPTRMDYSKVIKAVRAASSALRDV